MIGSAWFWVSLAALAVLLLIFLRRPSEPPPLVLGQELANAAREQASHSRRGDFGPSPIPTTGYRADSDHIGLVNIEWDPFDEELVALTHRFASADLAERERMRAAASMDDFYTLIGFARRSAVFSLKRKDTSYCARGLIALAMIDSTRVDFRDLLWAADLVTGAASMLGGTRSLMLDAAAFASSETRELLEARWAQDLSGSGYVWIETEQGTGLISSGGEPYTPARDLTAITLEVAYALRRGRYDVGSLEIATEVPGVWFGLAQQQEAKRILRTARGTSSIHAYLRDEYSPEAEAQTLMIWLAEMQSAADASSLAARLENPMQQGTRFRTAFAEGPLFCLLVAGSFSVDREPFESPESVAELAQHVREVLR